MKKRQVFGLVVAGLLAGFVSQALAQSATAYSSTAVGVIKKTLPAQKQALLSVPLDQESDEGDGFIFSSIPAIANLPNGSVVNFWDEEQQMWIPQSKTAKAGWGAEKNRLIRPGEAFFLKNNQATNIELIVSGEVPSDESIQQALAGGALMCVANPYPVQRTFSDFAFASILANGSLVNFWDEESQMWIPQSKTAKAGWGAEKNRQIKPGEGFFIKSASVDVTWTEVRPYTWPK